MTEHTDKPKPLCLHCGRPPKVKPETSRRRNTGLTRGLCIQCYGKAHRKGALDKHPKVSRGFERELWSKALTVDNYVNIKTPNGIIAEHRWVMEQHLGRRLVSGETVHHINGDRQDNRIENLELWASQHPYGQRVTDIIAYVATHHREAILAALADQNVAA